MSADPVIVQSVPGRVVIGTRSAPVQLAAREDPRGIVISNVSEPSITGLEPGRYGYMELWVGGAKYEILCVTDIQSTEDVVRFLMGDLNVWTEPTTIVDGVD